MKKKNILKLFISLLSLIFFITIMIKVINKDIFQMDMNFYNFISKYLITSSNTVMAKIITNFGSSVALISITLVLLMVIKNKKIGLSISYNLIFITSLNLIIKSIVGRPRPSSFGIISESGYSFPSGHSMISASFYGYLIYLIYKYIKNKIIKWLLIILFSLLIILIGFSRIYLGVHYLSDVIAGFLISMSYLVGFSSVVKMYIGGSNEVNK